MASSSPPSSCCRALGKIEALLARGNQLPEQVRRPLAEALDDLRKATCSLPDRSEKRPQGQPLPEKEPLKDSAHCGEAREIAGRKQNERQLEEQRAVERDFLEKLTALHEITNDLNTAKTFDGVCRKAVQLGSERLGLERVSLWFVAGDGGEIEGTYGIDETGSLRDERGVRIRIAKNEVMGLVLASRRRCEVRETGLRNHRAQRVGFGQHAVSALWDGNDVIGLLAADNLLTGRPFGERVQELMALFASSLGHICSRKRTEEALRESEERYRRLVDLMPDAMSVVLDERLVYSNAAAARLLGVDSPEALRDQSVWDFVPPESHPLVRRLMARIVEGGETMNSVEIPLLRAHGSPVSVEMSAGPTVFGGLKAIQTVTRDVTERAAAREALLRAHTQLEERVEARTSELRGANAALEAEIAERRRAETESEDARNYLQAVVEHSHDGILVIDAEGRFEFANQAAFRTFGWPEEELIGHGFMKLMAPDFHEFILARWEEVQAGRGRPYEVDVLRKSGERRSLMVSHTHMTIRGERKYCVITKDVTESRRAKKALAQQRLTFETILQQAADGIAVCDRDERLAFVNQAALRIARSSPIGSKLSAFFQEWGAILDQRGNPITAKNVSLGSVLRGERVEGHEVRLQRNDGSAFTLLVSAAPLKDPDGAVIGAVVSFADITARVRAENELERHRNHLEDMVAKRTEELSQANTLLQQEVAERLEIERALRNTVQQLRELDAIVNRSPAVVLRWRAAEGWPVEFVSGNVQQFGYSAGDLMSGRVPWPKIIHPVDLERVQQQLKRIEAEGKTEFNLRYRLCTAWGDYRWIEDLTQTLRDPEGAVTHYQGVLVDITEQVKAQERAQHYQRRLQSLASEAALAEERERRRIAEHLHDHVGQNLSLARIKVSEARRLEDSAERDRSLADAIAFIKKSLDSARFHTFELSSPVLHELGLEAGVETLVERMNKQHGAHIRFENDGPSTPLPQDSQLALYRAVRELLVNAIKHARAEHVEVRIRGEESWIAIVVEDDGVGFDPEEALSTSRPDGGFGLFSLRERFAHMGGAFEIDSKKGKGTRATLRMRGSSGTLPEQPAKAEE